MTEEIVKPPRRLPCGKNNPESSRWYRSTALGKEGLKKYNTSEKGKASQKAYKQKNAGVINQKRVQKYRDEFPNGCLVCLECKSKYDTIRVIESAWKRIGLFNCICDLCA